MSITNSKNKFGPLKFEWTSPSGVVTVTDVPELLVHENGDYLVRAITEFDCSNTPSRINVNYQPIPKIKLDISWTGGECLENGGSLIVELTNDSDCKEEDITYFWTLPDGTTEETEEPKLAVHVSGLYKVYAKSIYSCFSVPTEKVVEYNPSPTFTLNGAEACEIDSQILEANIVNTDVDKDKLTYTWSNGGDVISTGVGELFRTIEVKLNKDIDSPTVEKYILTISTDKCDITHDAFVTFNPTPIFDLGGDLEMCDIENRILTIGDINYSSIIWNTGETTKSIKVVESGEYSVVVDLNGCTYKDAIYVEAIPFPKYSIDVLGVDCDTKVITLDVNTEEENVEYLWSTGETTKTIKVNKGGDYSIVVRKKGSVSNPKDEVGCSIAKNIELKNQFFEDLSSEEEINLCAGDSVTLKPNHEFESILWSTGATTPSITVKEGGIYEATITNKYYCNDKLTYDIIIDEGPEVTKVDVQEEYVAFEFEGGVAPFEYFVDDSQVYSKNIANDFTEGTHTLYIRDVNGCDCSEEFFVKDPIAVIDIVTPNGDGFNDTWEVEDLKRYPRSMVRIYDRYGRLMHKSPGVSLNWDGRFNGNNVPATDYWYHIDLFGDGRTVYTGHFALIR